MIVRSQKLQNKEDGSLGYACPGLGHGLSATFCQGGRVAPLPDGVQLYFKQKEEGVESLRTLALPLGPGNDGDLMELIQACEEACFGFGDRDVTDPTYRKALSLANDRFACSFHPADHGILHDLQTVMAPNAKTIRAELYTLNVYRPGDFFKAHVDTPKGEAMFGSLVVCLPSAYTGGQLHVRHRLADATFDWAERSGDTIQWVALYSDCEHEITEVTSGNRITLTYNLFADVSAKSPLAAAVDWSALPLYRALQSALGRANFLPAGGVLGFTCQFSYPHTNSQFADRPVPLLKGADAVLFAAVKQLGLGVRFVHLHRVSKGFKTEEEEGKLWMAQQKRRRKRDEAERAAAAAADVLASLVEAEADTGNGIDEEDVIQPHGATTAETKRNIETERCETDVVAPLSAWQYQKKDEVFGFSEHGFPQIFPVVWGGKDVKWAVDGPTDWEVGKVSVDVYGNHASSDVTYCAAAILVTVPSWDEGLRNAIPE
ncbi:hypothetical protein KFL_006780060 [Klebsormidium nitens]|uniref:Fe2OG dioxygenase domain-containing protein n=1 Tax=Klebsormidium nitens TaxID=105231 RepID=A0A1Y1IIQ2_KLENI|nr:hypothetical protein KFL_006780060 [Klebsormidium nitens]|eukprot:GAQ90735.1 hypothetical protein KFL_006780060 [Klebsormidium nitens]